MATLTVPQKTARLAATPVLISKLARTKTRWMGATLIIGSATKLGDFHFVTADGCDCTAAEYGMKCWHVDAYRHLQEQTKGRRMSDEEYAKACADVDALYG